MHHIIQAAFGWTDSHLHDFQIDGKNYGKLDGTIGKEEILDERKAKLSGLIHAGQRFVYEYDFGDGWQHDVIVEQIEDAPEPMGSAFIIDGARACPPEDVGGSWAYGEILTALQSTPHNQQAKDFLSWFGGSFDPELFDNRTANAALSRLAWNGWGQK